jgi:hypothetical protein
MNLINEFITNILIVELIIILLLFLREIGVISYIYEELYTNPKMRYLIKLTGDVLYMVGGSIAGAVIYAFYTTDTGFQIPAFIVGLIFIAYGAYLRDIKTK